MLWKSIAVKPINFMGKNRMTQIDIIEAPAHFTVADSLIFKTIYEQEWIMK